MAVINYKERDDPNKKNQYGVVSGASLVAPVILNQNSLDVEFVNGFNPEDVVLKWNGFYNFLQEKNIDTDINSLGGKEKISLPLINEFNTKIVKSPSRTITRASIEAVQRFNQKTDPNVQVDGWVGTQTIQLQYPKIKFLLTIFKVYDGKTNKTIEYDPKKYPSNSVIPILWGNKRFVIPLDDFNDANVKKISSYPFWRLYNPVTDKKNLPWNALSTQLRLPVNYPYREWDELDNTINIDNALSINQQTQQVQQVKNQLQSQTNVVKSIIK
jgi:hypothetical protein